MSQGITETKASQNNQSAISITEWDASRSRQLQRESREIIKETLLNHSHPRVTAYVPKAILFESQHQRLPKKGERL